MKHRDLLYPPTIALILLATGCTGSLPAAFRLQQQTENFAAVSGINTKVDILFVIDSSASMEPHQEKVRQGLAAFAQTYLKPTWDMRIAVIPSDLYYAHSSFSTYLNAPISASYVPPYINGRSSGGAPGRSAGYTSTPFIQNLFSYDANRQAGQRYRTNAAGVSLAQLKPGLAQNWGKLLPGNHDGPELGVCWDGDDAPNFITGLVACYHRDDPANSQYHTGTANCVSPNLANGETAFTQCVNTHLNNTVHTGKPFLSTTPPTGVLGDQAWINQLIADFTVQVSVSTLGSYSERSFSSMLQLLEINEQDPHTAFFRPGSLRVMVHLGDEDDQSMILDSTQAQPFTHYVKNDGSCPSGSCGNFNPNNCPIINGARDCCRHVDAQGVVYGPRDSFGCPAPDYILPLASVKSEVDGFFRGLDNSGASGNPNYFVTVITSLSGTDVRGDRYQSYANLVGNGSLIMDIESTDYRPIFASIGAGILQKKSVFQLTKAPTSQEDMIVKIIHADGSAITLSAAQYSVTGAILTISDTALVAALSSTDSLSVNYQPKQAF